LAWQTYSDDQTEVMVKALWSSVHGIKSNPGSDLAANNTPQLSDQTAGLAQLPSTPAVAETPPELLQQLQTIVSDLAVLRHAVEEIASNQGQTSRDIASIQAAQQNISQQISSLTRATSTLAAAQKSAAKPHPQATNQSTATVPGPAPPPARAPLPMPSASQSPTN
jgi:septal ring factor EnvC (AmiA/AmiB activator)